MAIFVGPTVTHDASMTPPVGVTGQAWAYLVSDSALVDLTGFITANVLTLGLSTANVRTPLTGAALTYIGISDAQRTSAIAAGATIVSGMLCFAKAFDAPAGKRGIFDPSLVTAVAQL